MKLYHGMKPYRFSFVTEGVRQNWVRFYHDDMELAFSNSKQVALREFSDAHSFMIESDQNSEEIRKSWGLPE